jgi:hypothetical protein
MSKAQIEAERYLKRKTLRGMLTWWERFYLWLKGVRF